MIGQICIGGQQLLSARPVERIEGILVHAQPGLEKQVLPGGAQSGPRPGIKISGLHRLRSNYAQDKYTKLRAKGLTDRQARLEVSHDLGITVSMW